MALKTTTHNDGSPMGNAYIGEEFKGLGICPEKDCEYNGLYFKCHKPCFEQCVTYIKRQKENNSKSGSELVKIIFED